MTAGEKGKFMRAFDQNSDHVASWPVRVRDRHGGPESVLGNRRVAFPLEMHVLQRLAGNRAVSALLARDVGLGGRVPPVGGVAVQRACCDGCATGSDCADATRDSPGGEIPVPPKPDKDLGDFPLPSNDQAYA